MACTKLMNGPAVSDWKEGVQALAVVPWRLWESIRLSVRLEGQRGRGVCM